MGWEGEEITQLPKTAITGYSGRLISGHTNLSDEDVLYITIDMFTKTEMVRQDKWWTVCLKRILKKMAEMVVDMADVTKNIKEMTKDMA